MHRDRFLRARESAGHIQRYASEGLNADEIASKLNRTQIQTVSGVPWTAPNVARLMRLFGIRPSKVRRPRKKPAPLAGALEQSPESLRVHLMVNDLDGWALLLSEITGLRVRFIERTDGPSRLELSGSIEQLHAFLAKQGVRNG